MPVCMKSISYPFPLGIETATAHEKCFGTYDELPQPRRYPRLLSHPRDDLPGVQPLGPELVFRWPAFTGPDVVGNEEGAMRDARTVGCRMVEKRRERSSSKAFCRQYLFRQWFTALALLLRRMPAPTRAARSRPEGPALFTEDDPPVLGEVADGAGIPRRSGGLVLDPGSEAVGVGVLLVHRLYNCPS